MKVEELGEFGLIRRITQQIARRAVECDASVIIGLGDDAAAWEKTSGVVEVLTTDTLVEGRHFDRKYTSWLDVGWKALASNLSDIAAMGATPSLVLVTLGLPYDLDVESVDAFYDGILECAAEYGGVVVGGDIVGSSEFFATIALIGKSSDALLLRSNAREGDVIAVTGTLGRASAGLVLLKNNLENGTTRTSVLRSAYARPEPRMSDGKLLVSHGICCAMDISDGFLADLGKLCEASAVGALIYASAIPIHPEVRRMFPEQFMDFGLGGGEDYELVFTGSRRIVDGLIKVLPSGGTIVGEIVQGQPGSVVVQDDSGCVINVDSTGWDHLLR